MTDHVSQTPRAYEPEVTLERIKPWLDQAGVTRLADITGMDNIGIPVYASVRPDSASLAVDCGKGITKLHAKASAAMEALERWVSDTVDVPHFRKRVMPGFETRFPVVRNAGELREIEWTTGEELTTGRSVRVPYHAAVVYRRQVPLSEQYFACSTNGLASGNTRDEAIASGLFEVIERDAVHVVMRRHAENGIPAPRYDLDSVEDTFTHDAVAKIRRAGCDLFVYDCMSDLQIPTFLAIIVDREKGSGLFKGYGCHLSPDVALNRAICEAAQSRCVIMAGARDDIIWGHHRQYLQASRKNWRAEMLAEPFVSNRERFRDHSTNSAEGDLETTIAILQHAGIPSPIVVDFPLEPEATFSVVRVLVPTLEGYFSLHGIESGDRCK